MELTIPAAIAGAAGKFGDGPALAEPGGPRISYHQLLHQTTTVTRALIAEGVMPGDRVAIWSPNTYHWVLGAFGALSAGATLVPVSTRFTGHEALDVIGRSGASVLIVADRFLGTDRLAALRAAAAEQAAEAARAGAAAENLAAEKRNLAGGAATSGKLRLVVRVPMPDPGEPGTATGPEDGVIGWAELAAGLGLDPVALAATIARFGEFARTGRDEDFHRGDSAYDRYYSDPRRRPNPCLAPLDAPPFYAAKIVPGDLGTKGGLRTDARARVLRPDGTPVAGLYAAGNASAAVMGHSYAGAGGTIGPAMTFGCIAALDLVAHRTLMPS